MKNEELYGKRGQVDFYITSIAINIQQKESVLRPLQPRLYPGQSTEEEPNIRGMKDGKDKWGTNDPSFANLDRTMHPNRQTPSTVQ